MSADMKKAVLGQESHPECSNKLPSCDTWTMVVPKGLGKSVIFHKKRQRRQQPIGRQGQRSRTEGG